MAGVVHLNPCALSPPPSCRLRREAHSAFEPLMLLLVERLGDGNVRAHGGGGAPGKGLEDRVREVGGFQDGAAMAKLQIEKHIEISDDDRWERDKSKVFRASVLLAFGHPLAPNVILFLALSG